MIELADPQQLAGAVSITPTRHRTVVGLWSKVHSAAQQKARLIKSLMDEIKAVNITDAATFGRTQTAALPALTSSPRPFTAICALACNLRAGPS